MKNITDIMLNPIRMRIIQVVATNDQITTSKICEKMPDIPRTTLYRHIKILIDNQLLIVVAENKIRGSIERTLSLNVQEIASHNTVEMAANNAFAFLMNKYSRFEKYFQRDDIDTQKDIIFLNNAILMTTDEEFKDFLSELKMLMEKYNFEYSEGRKPRDISIISAPSEDEGGTKHENNDNKKEGKR